MNNNVTLRSKNHKDLRKDSIMALSNNDIKKIRSLQQKKFRDESGLFIVEGEKMVQEAIDSPFTIENIYKKDEVGADAMGRISALSSPSPVLAVLRKPKDSIIDYISQLMPLISKGGLYLALDAIRDPGNLGTILRIADWFGIDAVFASKDTVDVFNPKVVQSTMGAVFRVKMHYVDLPQLFEKVLELKGKVYGTFLDGKNIYERELDCGTQAPAVIVIGNEANGISDQVAAMVSDRLYIPPYPQDSPGSESLNAAIATAITVAEFRRRK